LSVPNATNGIIMKYPSHLLKESIPVSAEGGSLHSHISRQLSLKHLM
jgi:hypothetical protein